MPPKLSVSIITYNHENYISQAIESVLKQQVDFPYEIIIGDDYSTDGTRQILQSYQQKYPDIIQLVLHPRRYDGVPGRVNNITNLYACRGQYIAMLDGDDYWISENKLQTQVDFLDRHPDYVLTGHDAWFFSEDHQFAPYYQNQSDDQLITDSHTYQDLINGWFINTSTLLFRNRLIGEFPEWFWEIYSADYALQMLIAQQGKIKFFENIKSARRINSTSFSVSYNKTLADNRLRLNELRIFRKHFPGFSSRKLYAKFYFRRALLYKKKKKWLPMTYYFVKSVVKNKKTAQLLSNSITRKISILCQAIHCTRLFRSLLGKKLWKALNALRYTEPGPKQAIVASDVEEEGMEWLWKGTRPNDYYLESTYQFLTVGKVRFIEPFVLRLHRGRVIGRRGDIVSDQGTIFTDVCPEIPRRPNHHFLLERGKTSDPVYIDGTVAVLNCGPYNNYFHYLFDAISRLQFFRKLDVSIDYYCTAYHTRFQKELCSHFGITPYNVIPLARKTHICAKNLIVSSLPGYSEAFSLVNIKNQNIYTFIREHLLNKIEKTTLKWSKNIYIQRTGNRQLANEEDLLNRLNQDDIWEVVRLEELSVLDQAGIFYQASLIVGVHGAGMANLVYAQPGTTVIEIFHPHHLEPIYFQLATVLKLSYHPIVGENYNGSGHRVEKLVWVDTELVKECIARSNGVQIIDSP